MKILHLRASNFYGGPERQLHLHALEALTTDCEVTVASFSEGGRSPEFLDRISADGVETHLFEVDSAYDPRAISALRAYISARGIDVLCTHEYRTAAVGWLATWGTDTIWIAFSRGFTTENLKIRLYHGLDKLLIRAATHIVAVSDAQKRKLEQLRIPAARITVVSNAIDPERMEAAVPVDLRARYDFDADTVVCVAGGRFSAEKGQVFLVEAAAQLLPDHPELRFVLFGDGPELPRLRLRIKELGLEGRVICPGFESDMAGCLRGADLLVNPSLSEGMPNIVLEAMALAVPVVATAVGGVPEIIEDGRTGRLVDPADAGELARAIAGAVVDPEGSRRMATAARDHVSAQLGFSRQFQQLREVYSREIVRRGG